MTRSDGGPAFPRPCDPCSCNGVRGSECNIAYDGMSLRDWFAGMALQKLAGEIGWHTLREHSSELSETCYHMADAMIERINHQPPNESTEAPAAGSEHAEG